MASVRNCSFHNNSAVGKGGAFYCANRADVEIFNCVFRDNYALNGGAIGINHACSVHVENCEIRNNNETRNGGAVYIESNDNSQFVNCIIADNSAEFGGAGYIHFYSDTRFYNCTISNNTASERGSAFYIFEFAKPRFTNTIIWNNKAPKGTQVWIYDPDSRPDFHFCVVEDGRRGIEGNGYARKFDTVSVEDPLFTDMSKGDYSLSAKSPCINAGTLVVEEGWEFPLKDIAGNKRINQGIVDIGALEYTGMVSVTNRLMYNTENHQKFTYSRTGAGCIAINLPAFTESRHVTNLTVNVFSPTGRLVYTLSRTNVSSQKIVLTGLNKNASGIYLVELKDDCKQLGTFPLKMD